MMTSMNKELKVGRRLCVFLRNYSRALEMNSCITIQVYLETEIEELDFNMPFSFHFLGFLLLGLQTVVFLTLLSPVPHFLDTDSTELALAPTCDDTGAHSHGQSL